MAHVEDVNSIRRFVHTEDHPVGLEQELAEILLQVISLASIGASLGKLLQSINLSVEQSERRAV